MPYSQPKPAPLASSAPLTGPQSTLGTASNPVNVSNVSNLGIAGDDQRSIDELMSMYDSSMNSNGNLNKGGAVEEQNPIQSRFVMEDNNNNNNNNVFRQVIGMGSNIFEEVNSSVQPQFFNFGEDVSPMEPAYNSQPNHMTNMNSDFRFGSPFSMPAMDFNDALPRGMGESLMTNQNNSNWFF